MPIDYPYRMSDWYGYSQSCSSYDYIATLTQGTGSFYGTTAYGYGNSYPWNFGSLSTTFFDGSFILSFYYSSPSNYLYILFDSAKPSFSEMLINGVNYGSSSTWESAGANQWRKSTPFNPFGGAGTYTIQATY